MPLWYPTGARNEHLAVLNAAGLFDTSHMAVIMISGPDAFRFLQLTTSKNLERVGKKKLPLGHCRCTNSAFLDERGWVVDDCVVYYLDPTRYMAAVNAGMGDIVAAQLGKYTSGFDVTVDVLADRVAKFDIQGQRSGRILSRCLRSPEAVFDGMGYYRFKGRFDGTAPRCDEVVFTNGVHAMLSRSGYTGEFGFEIFVDAGDALSLWEMIFAEGEGDGLTACGLASRDSLRAGAVLPLSHQDIGGWPFLNNPWVYALPYNDDMSGFTKDFVGRAALEASDYSEHTLAFAGYDLRKVDTHGEPASVYDGSGARIGTVLTCATDVAVGRVDGRIVGLASPDAPEGFAPRGLSCGFVRVNRPLDYGEIVTLRDSRREIRVEIVRDVRPGRTARKPMREMLGI